MKGIFKEIGIAIALALMVCVALFGVCSFLFWGETHNKAELLTDGMLEDVRVGAIIPDSVVAVNIDGTWYHVEMLGASVLRVGEHYYLYRYFRQGWNSKNEMTRTPLENWGGQPIPKAQNVEMWIEN